MNEQKPQGNGQQRRLRVGIIFGGRSSEHEVSLMSARSVMEALDSSRYEVVPVGIDRQGRWLLGDAMAALADAEGAAASPATLLPDPQSAALMRVAPQEPGMTALSEAAQLDVILPVLHGPYGEDGTLQGLLELAGLPYVGAGVVGSAVGMDKAIFKSVMTAHDIPVLPWRLVLASDWRSTPDDVLGAVEQALTYPLFVKPANLGSSVGVGKAQDRASLRAALDEAARYDRRLVVEQGIEARELEVSVLGNDDPIASVVGEIRPQREFYDYVAKYVSDDSELLIPAPLPAAVSEAVRALAVRAYRAIDCAGLGRVDVLLDRRSNAIFLNEINTIPGFTKISMYPKLWEASGISYSELLDRLIALALERHAEKQQLKTTYTPDEL
ncbi:MAG: D-alanine--D-alanine ligase family protein [Candidatus Promineifilaceae bacterium]|nr:D-alanine--D-alanine ligase family protein [Candidatus Promineifilaceae bacterium]